MPLKQSIQNLLFPLGSLQTIKFGYLRTKKLVLSENTQWAPLFGRWEPAMQKIIANVVKEGDTVYDLGANFGLHGMLCAKLIGETGFLYNFEPLPSNIKEIGENYKLNQIVNYKNIQKAVSNQNSVLNFSVADHATQGKLEKTNTGYNSINVEVITLDQFIAEGNRSPNFIKMDIEGAEGEALEGYSKNIEKTFPLMIIELHSPEADKKVGEFLKFYNYKAYRFNTFTTLQFEQVKNLSLPYPHKEGIWGSVFCIGPNKALHDFSFNH
jgi:FkbM family methyltransferase